MIFPLTSTGARTITPTGLTTGGVTVVTGGRPALDRDGSGTITVADVTFSTGSGTFDITGISTSGGLNGITADKMTISALTISTSDSGTVSTGGDRFTLKSAPADRDLDFTLSAGDIVSATVTSGGATTTLTLTEFIGTADPPLVGFSGIATAGTVNLTYNIYSGDLVTLTSLKFGGALTNAEALQKFAWNKKLPRDSGVALAAPAANAVYDAPDLTVVVDGTTLKTGDYSWDFTTKLLTITNVTAANLPNSATNNLVVTYKYSEFDNDTPGNTPLFTTDLQVNKLQFAANGNVAALAAGESSGVLIATADATLGKIGAFSSVSSGDAVLLTFKYDVDDKPLNLATVSTLTSSTRGQNRKVTGDETTAKSSVFSTKIAVFSVNDFIKIDAEAKNITNDALSTGDGDGVVQIDELNNTFGLSTSTQETNQGAVALSTRVQAAATNLGLTPSTTKATDLLPRIVVGADGETLTVSYADADPAGDRTATATLDFKAPTITLIRPGDNSFAGSAVTLEADVTDAGAGITSTDLSLTPPTAVTLATAVKSTITDGFRISRTVPTGGTIPEALHKWNIVVKDSVGNKPADVDTRTAAETTAKVANPAVHGTVGNLFAFTVDANPPTIDRAETGGKLETDPTKSDAEEIVPDRTATNAVTVFLDLGLGGAPVDADTVQPSDFEVNTNPDIPVVQTIVGKNGKRILLLLETAMDSGARPTVKLVGAINDKAANATVIVTVPADKVIDRLAPTVTATISGELASTPASKNEIVITITSTESGTISGTATYLMASGDRQRVNADGDGTLAENPERGLNEKLTFTSTGVNIWESKVTIRDIMGSTLDSSGAVNVQIEVADGGGNTGDVGLPDPEFELASDIKTAGVLHAKALVFEFDNLLNGGEKRAEKIFVLSPNTKTATDPETDNPLAFITINFDAEGKEYVNSGDVTNGAGTFGKLGLDTHEGVTLTKAELQWPDGSKTDVLSDFSASDVNSFVLGAASLNDGAGLVLGKYKLTVNAVDLLGNNSSKEPLTAGGATTATNYVYEFEVIAKAQYSVTLAPGLNLTSIPGDPVDGDINAVISTADGVDLVTTYDPSAALGPWLVATRDATTGLFTGTLNTIDAKHAYWMRTTSFVTLKVDIPLQALTGELPPTLAVQLGWNLVPIVDLTRRPFGTAIDADIYLTGVKWALAYTFDTVGSAWRRIVPNNDNNTTTQARCEQKTDTTVEVDCDSTNTILKKLDTGVVVGRGYWVWATAAGTIVP